MLYLVPLIYLFFHYGGKRLWNHICNIILCTWYSSCIYSPGLLFGQWGKILTLVTILLTTSCHWVQRGSNCKHSLISSEESRLLMNGCRAPFWGTDNTAYCILHFVHFCTLCRILFQGIPVIYIM